MQKRERRRPSRCGTSLTARERKSTANAIGQLSERDFERLLQSGLGDVEEEVNEAERKRKLEGKARRRRRRRAAARAGYRRAGQAAKRPGSSAEK